MAVNATVVGVKLQMRYLGPVVGEKQTYISKTYSKVRPEATDQDIYDAANIIAGLQTNSIFSIDKIQDSELAGA